MDSNSDGGTGGGGRHESTLGRAKLDFSSLADIDEFVTTLDRFEKGEISPDQWKAYRLVRGVYGQRQDGVQMFRVKVPQGILQANALRALADACEIWSRGFGHITTRQNIQMHFVLLKDSEACMRRLAEAGLTTREACGNSVRNITGCAFSGVCRDEHFDVTPYAQALTRYLLRHPLSGTLPRKFKIGFSGCDSDCGLSAIQDIGFLAKTRVAGDGRVQRGFTVRVGGGTSTLCHAGDALHELLPANEIFDVAEACLRIFNRLGDRKNRHKNRMKWLIRKIGYEAWKALYEEEIKAIRAAGGAGLPFDPDAPEVEQAPDWPRPDAPTFEQVRARAAAAKLKGPGIVPDLSPPDRAPDGLAAPSLEQFTRTNVHPQKQAGWSAVVVHVPMGDLTGPQLRILADLAECYGDGSVRTTQGQDVVFRWVRDGDVRELHLRLVAAGLGRANAGTIADVTSCPGAESCRLAVTQSRGLGREIVRFLESRPDLIDAASDAIIKISGCPNGCGQNHIATLGLQGSVRRLGETVIPQYFLQVGGGVAPDGSTRFGERMAKIPARRVTEALERLIGWYVKERAEGESSAAFFGRADPEKVASLLSDLTEISPETAKPEDYIDIAEDHVYKVETMEGECAA